MAGNTSQRSASSSSSALHGLAFARAESASGSCPRRKGGTTRTTAARQQRRPGPDQRQRPAPRPVRARPARAARPDRGHAGGGGAVPDGDRRFVRGVRAARARGAAPRRLEGRRGTDAAAARCPDRPTPPLGRIQDPYGFRCVPQIHGPAHDAANTPEEVLAVEIDAAAENPLISSDDMTAYHHGGFYLARLALVLDHFRLAATQVARLATSRLSTLNEPGPPGRPPALAAVAFRHRRPAARAAGPTAQPRVSDTEVQVHVPRRIVGHSSLTTTQRYLHPDAHRITAAGAALSAHFSVLSAWHSLPSPIAMTR